MDSLDRISLEDEQSLYNAYLDDVGIGKRVSIETTIFRDTYEVFVERWDTKETQYFDTLDEALEYCKQEYPEANWDVIG